jgi:alpha-N-arabinofuranosidase
MKFSMHLKTISVSLFFSLIISIDISLAGIGLSNPDIYSISEDTLTVDVSQVINDTRRRQIGINTCILTDDDQCYFRNPARPYNDAIKELGVKYLRYPGGYKSDVIFWSNPPYDKSNPALVYKESSKWPSSDTALVNSDGSWRVDLYDFDEFMATCKKTGAEPVLVVTYNPLRWPAPDGSQKPSKEQIIENARQWVQYANVVKKYNVKYWEIGNETWLDSKSFAVKIQPDIYANDILEIAKAMKDEDPGILIGANADSEEYCKIILSGAAQVIDFISAHSYPLYARKSYYDYLSQEPDACGIIKVTKKAMEAFPELKSRDIKIMVTEFAAGSFSGWDREGSNLGRAIITFDLQGQLLQEPACYFSQFWNTINVYDKDNSAFNALRYDNSLTAIGKAISLWGKFLEDEMLQTKGGNMVKCFATKTDGASLTVFIINKDTIDHKVPLQINNANEKLESGESWIFTGASIFDSNPELSKQNNISYMPAMVLLFPAISINILRFKL